MDPSCRDGRKERGVGGVYDKKKPCTNPQILMMFWSNISQECKVDPGHVLSNVPALSTVGVSPSKLVGLLQPWTLWNVWVRIHTSGRNRFNYGISVRQGGTTKASYYTTQGKLSLKGVQLLLVKSVELGCLSLFPIMLLDCCEQNKLFHCHLWLKFSLHVMWKYGTLQMQIAAQWL